MGTVTVTLKGLNNLFVGPFTSRVKSLKYLKVIYFISLVFVFHRRRRLVFVVRVVSL